MSAKNQFMIFKGQENTAADTEYYNRRISEFSEKIANEKRKGKKVLMITGSGISQNVPGMNALLDKIVKLIDGYDRSWNRSVEFETIYQEYLRKDETEKHQMQSRLLTYIQNAYMGKEKYVQPQDLKPLSKIWNQFVVWLIKGDGTDDFKGIVNAAPSENHYAITELYQNLDVVSVTTNFDNLLHKAFGKTKNFYPILDSGQFDRYFLSSEDDQSFIEIQSRGDVFWMECLGNKNKICSNRSRQCYVPGYDVNVDEKGRIVCSLCGSEARIYFAFPGTKEKDQEMSEVIDGVWKYLSNMIGAVIITGSSMDYDPVLVEFLRELMQKKRVPVLYISSIRKGKKVSELKEDSSEIYAKAATRLLFFNRVDNENLWARSEHTNQILLDIVESCKSFESSSGNTIHYYNPKTRQDAINAFQSKINRIFTIKVGKFEQEMPELVRSRDVPAEILQLPDVDRMKYYSQLGMKTYWLRDKSEEYKEHNRLKHSVGVMLIASYLYLKICNCPNEEELRFLQLAALFHDIGHLPFSHLLEEVFDEFGWIPAGESKTFNHEQHTRNMISRMVETEGEIRTLLEKIHYDASDLQMLINGEFGKGYLDALINSPVDCDKIEYLFSDAIFMNRGTKEDFDHFIKLFAEDLSVNKEHFLVIEKNSTKAFLKLIKMRGEMYDQVYLRSGLRYLEACCKLVLRTFIAYICTEDDVFSGVEDREAFQVYYNLSDSKIRKVIDYMQGCLNQMTGCDVCELSVLNKMKSEMLANPVISPSMKMTIEQCMNMIENTRGDEKVADIERERIRIYEVNEKRFDKRTLKQILKDAYLRFPGVILVDLVEGKSSFSFGKRETRRHRSDGTRSAAENILIKDIMQNKGRTDTYYQCLGDSVDDVNKELHYSNHRCINLYRITDNLFSYMQAQDFIVDELRKEGMINEQ